MTELIDLNSSEGYEQERKDIFLTGLVCALHSVMASDHPVIARHIVDNNTNIQELKSYVARTSNEHDHDLIVWLEKEYNH